MKYTLILTSFLVFLAGCQGQGYRQSPPSAKLTDIAKSTPHKLEIKKIETSHIRRLLKKFKKTLHSKKKLKAEDWQVHDELLDAYIILKYIDKGRVVTVPPRSRLRVQAVSFCLNPSQAIPSSKESYYISQKEVIPYQKELTKWAMKFPEEKKVVQEVFWNLYNGVQWDSLPEKHRVLLKKIDSKAPIKLPSKVRQYLQERAKNYLLKKLDLPGVSDLVEGRFYSYEDYASRLQELTPQLDEPLNQPRKVEGTPLYSLSESDGYQEHNLNLYNPSSEPVSLDLSQVTLVPLRKDVQPLGLYPSVFFDQNLFKDLEFVLFDLMMKAGLGSVPVVGDLIDLYEVMASKDFFTGEELTPEDRLLSSLGLMAGSGKVYRMAKKGLSAPKKYIKELGKRYKTFLDPQHAKEGKKLADKIAGKVPDDWVVKPGKIKTKQGKVKPQGLVVTDPDNEQISIRFMPGDPGSKYSHQRKPYAVVKKGNQFFDKNGKKVSSNKEPGAHIPLDEFDFDKVWKK